MCVCKPDSRLLILSAQQEKPARDCSLSSPSARLPARLGHNVSLSGYLSDVPVFAVRVATAVQGGGGGRGGGRPGGGAAVPTGPRRRQRGHYRGGVEGATGAGGADPPRASCGAGWRSRRWRTRSPGDPTGWPRLGPPPPGSTPWMACNSPEWGTRPPTAPYSWLGRLLVETWERGGGRVAVVGPHRHGRVAP